MSPRARTIALLLVGAQVAAVVAGAWVYAWYSHSVEGSGRWVATKAHLGRKVMGAVDFARSHHTLAGGQLDLGRWFGFQEVVLREPVLVRTVELDFRPEPGAWLALRYGPGPEGGAGLLLGTDERFPSGSFTVDAAGEFEVFEPLTGLRPAPGAWAHLALEFGPAGVSAALDGGAPQRIGEPTSGPQHLAFRGGQASVVLDDVRVRCDGPGGFDETFFHGRGFARGLLALVGLLALDVLAWRLVRRWRVSGRRLLALAVGSAASLLFVAAAIVVLQRTKAGRYPRANHDAEAAWLSEEATRVAAEVRARHAPAHPGVTRVLVVGTSQTWGAGATRAEEGFVPELERQLEAARPGRDFECVNGGVSGLRAPRLLELFQSEWLALEPDLVVLNLSNNDKDAASFAAALRGFADLCAEHEIALLFALEANASEAVPGPLALHPTMRAVAAERGIEVLDLHQEIARHSGRGFLWWDFVHPTSFGHRLLAEALAPAVLARLPG